MPIVSLKTMEDKEKSLYETAARSAQKYVEIQEEGNLYGRIRYTYIFVLHIDGCPPCSCDIP